MQVNHAFGTNRQHPFNGTALCQDCLHFYMKRPVADPAMCWDVKLTVGLIRKVSPQSMITQAIRGTWELGFSLVVSIPVPWRWRLVLYAWARV